jgi:hypothetical protein
MRGYSFGPKLAEERNTAVAADGRGRRVGAPAAIVPSSTSRVTTELAPITQRLPTLTPLVTAS